ALKARAHSDYRFGFERNMREKARGLQDAVWAFLLLLAPCSLPLLLRRLSASVAVVLRLVRPFDRYTNIVGLVLRKGRQFGADLLEVQASDFLVEVLRETVNTDLIGVALLPEVDLREDLVREAVRHHERRMSRG